MTYRLPENYVQPLNETSINDTPNPEVKFDGLSMRAQIRAVVQFFKSKNSRVPDTLRLGRKEYRQLLNEVNDMRETSGRDALLEVTSFADCEIIRTKREKTLEAGTFVLTFTDNVWRVRTHFKEGDVVVVNLPFRPVVGDRFPVNWRHSDFEEDVACGIFEICSQMWNPVDFLFEAEVIPVDSQVESSLPEKGNFAGDHKLQNPAIT